jgi:hypothetical protein
MTAEGLRVAQWATGNIGLKSLRGIIEHPGMTLAGVHVYDPDKIGRDAGELCGMAAVGVAATGRLEDILATGADCVVYMPRAFDAEDVCRMLESGMNIVTTCGQFHHPASMDADLRDRVEAACRAGRSSVHSTGSSPGFISEALPLVLTSVQRRLDRLVIEEHADLSQRPSPELLFDLMGFGQELAPFQQFRADYLCSSFGPSLRLLGDSIGLPLDDVTASGELAASPRDIDIAAGVVRANTVAAQRITVSGHRDGAELIRFCATWYCTTDLEPAWDLRDTGWHVGLDGDAPLEVTVRMPVPLRDMAETAPGYTANRAVNAVAAVCAASPGIRTTTELTGVSAVFC